MVSVYESTVDFKLNPKHKNVNNLSFTKDCHSSVTITHPWSIDDFLKRFLVKFTSGTYSDKINRFI